MDDTGRRVVDTLGEPAAHELLGAITRSDADRAALIGRLYARVDAKWLAELLMDLEGDAGELARVQLAAQLQQALGGAGADHQGNGAT